MEGSSQQPTDRVESSEVVVDLYGALYEAAIRGDWVAAETFFESNPDAMFAKINSSMETALHVAVWSGQTKFVKELVGLIPPDKLVELKSKIGYTALHSSVQVGDSTEAAKALVQNSPDLPQIRCTCNRTPIKLAAMYGRKELLGYLCEVTKDEDPSPFQGNDGVSLLNYVILAGFYDVALHLLQRFPELSTGVDYKWKSALETLAKKSSAFKSGSQLGFWERCIYKYVHVDVGQTSHPNQHFNGDTEDPPLSCLDRLHKSIMQRFLRATQVIQVPCIKQIYNTKLMHYQTNEIVRFICEQAVHQGKYSVTRMILGNAAQEAAEFGTVEVIAACLQFSPRVISWHDAETWHSLLHIAIMYRRANVFKLLRGFGAHAKRLAAWEDFNTDNNILHLAANLAPSSILNSIPGIALQMQQELQWYKEVEKIAQPKYKESLNKNKRTPPVLFTEEHKNLVEKGEKWMKETASSCMVVATLIATVTFAAALSVPGGYNDDGMPIFLKSNSFIVFATADALALFSSTSSVLMFLSILTSRYAEEDFLISLPTKLIIGLSALFFSIITMMMAFSTTFIIFFGHQLAWIFITVSILATLPVFFFALSHFPLFVEMILSTYGSNIYTKPF